MGTNMYPSSALLGQNKDATLEALPVDELIEKADGFAGVFPGESNTYKLTLSRLLLRKVISTFCLWDCLLRRTQVRDREETAREEAHRWYDWRRCQRRPGS
jgi:hypothetical protein